MSKDEIALEALGLLTKYEDLKKEHDSLKKEYTSLWNAYSYNYSHRWISVKDMLPEKPCKVIVYCPNYTNYEAPIMAEYIITNDGLKFWDFDPLNDNDITNDVTHWMFAPNKPD